MQGGSAPLSNFDYASVFTEAILPGNVAIRMGKPIEYDDQKRRDHESLPEKDKHSSQPAQRLDMRDGLGACVVKETYSDSTQLTI